MKTETKFSFVAKNMHTLIFIEKIFLCYALPCAVSEREGMTEIAQQKKTEDLQCVKQCHKNDKIHLKWNGYDDDNHAFPFCKRFARAQHKKRTIHSFLFLCKRTISRAMTTRSNGTTLINSNIFMTKIGMNENFTIFRPPVLNRFFFFFHTVSNRIIRSYVFFWLDWCWRFRYGID